MKLTTFETYGIGFSIAAMVLALWVIRLETTNDSLAEQVSSPDGAVFIADGENQRAAVADALMEASEAGDITRLIIDDVVTGEGAAIEEGDRVAVHYIGTLQNGQQFDNSYLRGEPFTFTVGDGRVIEGWEQGVIGMREGGQRILVIPSEMAYGKEGYGPIPGNATLVFAIELISIDE